MDIGAFEWDANGIAAVAADFGGSDMVIVTEFGGTLSTFTPYAGYTGGLRLATGNVSGSARHEIIVAAGPGELDRIQTLVSSLDESVGRILDNDAECDHKPRQNHRIDRRTRLPANDGAAARRL